MIREYDRIEKDDKYSASARIQNAKENTLVHETRLVFEPGILFATKWFSRVRLPKLTIISGAAGGRSSAVVAGAAGNLGN